MRKLSNTIAALSLVLSTSAASACEIEKVTANFGYMRSKPDLGSPALWKLGNDISVVWCGRTSTDRRGIVWNWVATEWSQERWPHKGWISSRIVERDVPTITLTERPQARFEDGGE
jgi:hypothetical protein